MTTARDVPQTRRDLGRFFSPKSIAIVGASQDLNTISGQPLKFLTSHGYKGRLFPLAIDLEDVVAELDVNPLFVMDKGHGVVAADALIRPRVSAQTRRT